MNTKKISILHFYFSTNFFHFRELGDLYVQGFTLFGLRQGGAGEFRRHQIFMSRGCSQGLVGFPFPLQFPLRNFKILIAKVVLFCIFIPGGCAFFSRGIGIVRDSIRFVGNGASHDHRGSRKMQGRSCINDLNRSTTFHCSDSASMKTPFFTVKNLIAAQIEWRCKPTILLAGNPACFLWKGKTQNRSKIEDCLGLFS